MYDGSKIANFIFAKKIYNHLFHYQSTSSMLEGNTKTHLIHFCLALSILERTNC